MKFRLSILFLLINILISQTLKAQNKDLKYTYSFGVESFAGFIVRHHADMGHYITGHPTGARINMSRYSYGEKEWEQRYGYPTFSSSLSYYDLKNDQVLGKALSLCLSINFHLNDITNSNNDFYFSPGFGLVYVSKPYDSETNYKNNAISSHLPWYVSLRFGYYRQLTKRLKVGGALQFSHYSNASRSVPNYGLNVPNINLGVKYAIEDKKPAYKDDKLSGPELNKKIFTNVDFRIGRTELHPIGSGPSFYYAISVFLNKRVSAKSIIDFGIEGFANKAFEKQIIYNQPLVNGYPDFRSLGIMFGHEMLLNKLALVTQLGVYIYKPYQPYNWLYTKLGLKYYFTDNIFSSFILKSHYSIAEVLEYGVGVRF